MRKKLAWLAAIACVAWLVPAWALSLGGIRVHSRLNQPLSASIPIYPATGEIVDENVKIRLASNEDYARVGLERLDLLSDLSFAVEPDRVVISSHRTIREPVVDLLLEVTWSGGRLLRQYTLLLDPEGVGPAPTPLEPSHQALATPDTAGQAAARAAGGMGTVSGSRARSSADSPAAGTPPLASRRGSQAGASGPPEVKSAPRTYGPVRANETPWTVATKLKPDDSITTEQVVIALFQWNPTTFNSALSGFKPGSVLRVPDAEVMRRVDPQIARARLAEARERAEEAAQAAAPPKPAPAAPIIAEPAPLPTPEPKTAAPAPSAETPAAKTETPPETAPAPSTTAPATSEPTTAAPAAEAPAASPPAESTPPPQETQPAAAPAPEPEVTHKRKSAMDDWLIWAVAGAAIVFVVLLVWRLARRPKSPGEEFAMQESVTLPPTSPRAPPAAARAPIEPAPTYEPEPPAAREPIAPEPEIAQPPPQRITIPEPAAAPPPAAPAAPKPAPAAKTMTSTASFSDTALTDTRQIDLEGGDALAEADFHLAYGLYDEAILLLTQALTRDPNRTDVRTKLAEAYFSANRGQEFLDTAKTLKGQLDPAGWEKIAVLGRQLFPSDPMFGGSGKAQPAPSGEVATAPPRGTATGGTIPFDMPAATPPKPAAPPPTMPTMEAAKTGAFDLGALDLDTPIDAPAAAAPAPAAGAGVDLESSIGMDDPGLGGDEASTKLDLARAYIDLGDNDMAKGLLSEVVQQGNSEQKQAAEELMRKLPA